LKVVSYYCLIYSFFFRFRLQVNVLEEQLISYKQMQSHRKSTTQEASDQEEEIHDEEFRYRSQKDSTQTSSSNLRQLKWEIEIVRKLWMIENLCYESMFLLFKDKDEEIGIEFGYAEPKDSLELRSHSTSDLNHKMRRASRSSSLASSYKNTKKRCESIDCLNIEMNQEETRSQLDHNGIFIKHVSEHSNAYGKLKFVPILFYAFELDKNLIDFLSIWRPHDQLIKIDEVDLRTTNLEEFQKIVLNLDGLVNFVTCSTINW